jgi:hypothetical protein
MGIVLFTLSVQPYDLGIFRAALTCSYDFAQRTGMGSSIIVCDSPPHLTGSWILTAYTCTFTDPQNVNSRDLRSGDRGAHYTGPLLPVHR